MYYVYFLISPVDGKVFYIGKGKGNRMRKHVHLAKMNKVSNGNDYLFRKIKSILENFSDVEYRVVWKTDNEIEAYEKEQEYISEFGLENLCNISLGYNQLTDEIKSKISESIKKLYKDDNYKFKLRQIYDSSEYRSSQSIAVKNSQLHKEKMASEEVRQLISQKLKQYYINVYGEFQDNKVECSICKNTMIVYERQFLLSDKYYCSSDCRFMYRKSNEYRSAMSESLKKSKKHKAIYTDEFKKNISNSAKEWWKSLSNEELEDYKQKMSETLKNSQAHKDKLKSIEYRKNLSDGLKNSKSFEEYNKRRTGKERGKYKESQKNLQRRNQSVLVNSNGDIVKEFSGLQEICDYFDIKIPTACVWLKKEKIIGELQLKRK